MDDAGRHHRLKRVARGTIVFGTATSDALARTAHHA